MAENTQDTQTRPDSIRVDALASGRWHDPFAVLGPHADPQLQDGLTVVRTFQPGARSVRVLAAGAPPGAASLATLADSDGNGLGMSRRGSYHHSNCGNGDGNQGAGGRRSGRGGSK